jgi:uncharacterized protein (DUF2147 family)
MPFETQGLRFAALAAGLFATFPAFAADDPSGVWVNDTGRGAIEIKQCGSKLCGHVIWVMDTTDVNGCGRQILGELGNVGDGTWGGDGAWVYNPDKKKKYNVEVTPLDDGTLKVKGFAGISFLSKTMIWTKAPDSLPRCNEQTAAAPKSDPVPAPAPDSAAAPAEKAAPPADDSRDVAKNDGPAEEEGGIDGGDFSDVFTMKDGKCKLDTPWVKLDIDCKKKEGAPEDD